MPGGRPTSYKPEYCERVIELGKEGKSQVQIAVALGVLRQTMLSWQDNHPEFSTALTRAKECEQDWWENQATNGSAQSVIGPAIWNKSMSSRFRETYTERKEVEHSGTVVNINGDDAEL